LAQNQTTPRTMQQMLGFLPMLIVVLFLASLPLLKIDHRSGSPDIGHVQIVMAKKNAWLMQHPLLLKVSQMNFAGVSGEFMTSTCWHLVRNVSHRQQP
jgi:hypothetical protein